MNLMDVLLYQDRKHLVKLLEKNGHCCNHHSKRELIEVLYPVFLRFDYVNHKYQNLSGKARTTLIQLAYDDRLFVSKEELLAQLLNSEREFYEKIIEELVRCGFLYKHQTHFIVPAELKLSVKRIIQEEIKDESIFLSKSNQKPELMLINDLIIFLDIVSEATIPLTKSNVMYKKNLQHIIDMFEFQETLPNDQWRFGYGRHFYHYPDRFSLIYDYCFQKGWIIEGEGFLHVTEKVEQLNKLGVHSLMTDISRNWINIYRKPIPAIRFLIKFLLSTLTEESSVELDCIITKLSPFVEDYYYDNKEDIIRKRLIQMLSHLNILELTTLNNLTYVSKGNLAVHSLMFI